MDLKVLQNSRKYQLYFLLQVKHCSTVFDLCNLLMVRIQFQSGLELIITSNRPFTSSRREFQSNDILVHFVGFTNVHKMDRKPLATQSNLFI